MAVIGTSAFSPIKAIYRGLIQPQINSNYSASFAIGGTIVLAKSFLTTSIRMGQYYQATDQASGTNSSLQITSTTQLTYRNMFNQGQIRGYCQINWEVIEYI
mgnify:FL=1